MRADAVLEMPAEASPQSKCGGVGRKMYRCHVPRLDGCWAPAVHSACCHNERVGLLTRTLAPTPEDGDLRLLKLQFKRLARLAASLQLRAWEREEVAASYTGRLAKRYTAAARSLEIDGLQPMHCKLSAFVKAEKFNPAIKGSKPRMIMARAPEYNLELMTRLKPLERALWHRVKGVCPGVAPTRQVGKGLSPPARARLILRKMQNLGDCVVFEVDGKAFEAHVTREQLLLEHSVYKAAYPRDEVLESLLSHQLELKGKTSSGIKFRREGCRASGDANTGLGNTLIMLCVCRAAVELIQRESSFFAYDLLADGDNCLLFLQADVAGEVRSVFASVVSRICSHELAVEEPEVIPERVVFGQCKPVRRASDWVMVRDPWKVLSQAFTGHRFYHEPVYGLRVAKAVALAETWLNCGVPVLGPYFLKAAKLLSSVVLPEHPTDVLEGWELLAVEDLKGAARVADNTPIAAVSRTSFEQAFGICPELQVLLEKRLTDELSFEHITPGYKWPMVCAELGEDSDNFDSLDYQFRASA
jgi:hypothetical protein